MKTIPFAKARNENNRIPIRLAGARRKLDPHPPPRISMGGLGFDGCSPIAMCTSYLQRLSPLYIVLCVLTFFFNTYTEVPVLLYGVPACSQSLSYRGDLGATGGLTAAIRHRGHGVERSTQKSVLNSFFRSRIRSDVHESLGCTES